MHDSLPNHDAVADAVGRTRAQIAFRRAHGRAALRGLLDRLRGTRRDLCSFEEARRRAGIVASGARRRTDVCLDRIRGSVGRTRDYTPDFLPRLGRDEERWARVWMAIESPRGVPPLELLELDGEYFVQDGHHRVSVLRAMGARCAEAYVTRLSSSRRLDAPADGARGEPPGDAALPACAG